MNKRLKKNIITSFFLFAFALVGCTSYDEPDRAKDIAKDTDAVYLSFDAPLSSPEQDATINNSTRSVAWTVEKLWGVAIAQLSTANARDTRFPAIIVIKNVPAQGSQEKVYYLSSTFIRQGDRLTLGENNPQGLSNVLLDKDIYGTDIRLNRSEQWYMMAYFKGEWDQANKRMTYEPHRNKSWREAPRERNRLLVPMRKLNDELGAIEDIDQPMILPWVKMTLKNSAEGKLIFSPEDESSNSSIKTMGTTIVLKIKGTGSSVQVLFRLGLHSNVLSNHGYYSLENQDLPAITTPDAIVNPVWYPLNGNNGFYTSPYMFLTRNGKISAPQIFTSEYQFMPVLWGMPVPNTSSSPTITEVRAEVSRTALTNYNQKGDYKTTIWRSSTNPKQFYSIGVRGTVSDTPIP